MLPSLLTRRLLTTSAPPTLHPLTDFVWVRLNSAHSTFLQTHFPTPPSITSIGTISLTSPSTPDLVIATGYKSDLKHHVLTLRSGDDVGEYVIQDNTIPPWHTSKVSVEERVHNAVDELVKIVEKQHN